MGDQHNTPLTKPEVWTAAWEAAKYFRDPSNALHGQDLYENLALIEFMPATRVGNSHSAPPCADHPAMEACSRLCQTASMQA